MNKTYVATIHDRVSDSERSLTVWATSKTLAMDKFREFLRREKWGGESQICDSAVFTIDEWVKEHMIPEVDK